MSVLPGVLFLLLLTACGLPASATLPAAQILPTGDGVSGRILFVKDGSLWVWADGRARQLTAGENWRQPQFSPDGTEIAYVYRSTNFAEIFVLSADGGDNRRLTKSQSAILDQNDWVFRPTWSPDGEQIAFLSDAGSYNPTVWVMNRDGSGRRQVLQTASFMEAADGMTWSPDGKKLAVAVFGSEQNDPSQIVLLDVARGTTEPLVSEPGGVLDPAWSPDGSLLAYAVREGGRVEVRVRGLDGAAEVQVTTGGLNRAPVFSPDGSRLAFISAKSGSFEIHIVDLITEGGQVRTRNERQLTHELAIDATSGLSWGK